jgi:outer membrane protein assembly factor BamA
LRTDHLPKLAISALLPLLILAGAARAGEDPFQIERAIADRMTTTGDRGWAILPQIGYSPEKSGNLGVKLSAHDIGQSQLGVDLEALYALAGQYESEATILVPEVFTEHLLGIVRASFMLDPTKEFFGLGNNDVDGDELSTNEYQTIGVTGALGIRPISRFSIAGTIGYRHIDIRDGKLDGDVPSTRTRFPRLVGIGGGDTSPVGVSLTFNSRTNPARPTEGWILMLRAERVDRALGNDYEYNRFSGDVSYLLPLVTRRQVLGIRIGGQFLDGDRREVPFYEFSALGDSRTLRGYFEDRFLGRAYALANAEYRLKLVDFNFFDIWDVQIDGVAFGDAGRVFLEDDKRRAAGGCPPAGILDPILGGCEELPDDEDEVRFSYGGGTRIALGKALVARIDVGFSEEETGLVYLTFGQTF